MSPNQETKNSNGDTGECYKLVSENPFPRKAGNQFTDHAHTRQDHDVNGGMGIEPEEMLKEKRIPAQRRIKDADSKEPLNTDEQDRDRDYRRAEHHNDRGRIV